VAEVVGLCTSVPQAFLVRVQHYVAHGCPGEITLAADIDRLRDVGQCPDVFARVEAACYLDHSLLAHAIYQQVGAALDGNRLTQPVLPVVIVRQPPHRSLYAAHHYGHVAQCLPYAPAIGHTRVVGTLVGTGVGGVGIVRAQAAVGRIAIDHRVHAPRRHPAEEARTSQFLEVTQVVLPARLRHDGDLISLCLQHTAYHGAAKRRVIDIGVAREDYYVHL